jgi:hypothetical protein
MGHRSVMSINTIVPTGSFEKDMITYLGFFDLGRDYSEEKQLENIR